MKHAASYARRNYVQHSSIIRISPPAQRGVLPRGKACRTELVQGHGLLSDAGTPAVRAPSTGESTQLNMTWCGAGANQQRRLRRRTSSTRFSTRSVEGSS